nr:MAG: RNA-dependent RNA polymerase [Riboviria sp.]
MVWAKMRVGMVRMGPLRKSTTVTIVSGCDRKYSLATLQPTIPLGRVAYSGSTQPGFSGSAYSTGEVVLGMHCHGGTRGGGYEILYLYVRLKEILDTPVEDSEEFFMRQATYGFDYEQLGMDSVVVRMTDGGYARTKQSILEQMKRIETTKDSNWADEVEYEELEDALVRFPESRSIENTAGFSGEDQGMKRKVVGPSHPSGTQSHRVSSSEEEQMALLRGKVEALTKDKEQLSQKHYKHLVQMNESMSKALNSLMSPPKPQPRQNGVALSPNGQQRQKSAKQVKSQQISKEN